jgi:hypothetical protein
MPASPSRGRSRALAALRMKLASMFTGLAGRARLARLAGLPFVSPARLACLDLPGLPSLLVGNGVVDDGAVHGFRLRLGREAASQRFRQRDL